MIEIERLCVVGVFGTWQRVAICVLLVVPLILLIAVVSIPAILLCFFKDGREFILAVFDKGIEWIKLVASKTAS